MKVRQGKAVSVALYGNVEEVHPRKQIIAIQAAEGGIHIVTMPDEKPVYINKSKISNLIQYLQRFAEEIDEE